MSSVQTKHQSGKLYETLKDGVKIMRTLLKSLQVAAGEGDADLQVRNVSFRSGSFLGLGLLHGIIGHLDKE